MNRPHLITRLFFVATGIYLLMRFFSGIGSAVISSQRNCPSETFTASMLITVVVAAITLAASLILLFQSDRLARMVTGSDADQCEKVNDCWIIAGLRMTLCLCGLLTLYPRIERLFYYIPIIIKGPILSYMTLEGQTSGMFKKLVGFIVELSKLILAIYLIYGAPHYVRWQNEKPPRKTR